MTISFDIDNTLIPYGTDFPVEKRPWWATLLGAEPVRRGTPELFRELERSKHRIWIYTSSLRAPWRLRLTFAAYGLWPQRIINQVHNARMLRRHQCSASKNPALFGIDLHVDDSPGVGAEGARWGFDTLIVAPADEDWTRTVLTHLECY